MGFSSGDESESRNGRVPDVESDSETRNAPDQESEQKSDAADATKKGR